MIESNKNLPNKESDIEWQNLDNFISDFAKNNEGMSVENDVKPSSKTSSTTEKTVKNQKYSIKNQSINPVSYKKVGEVSKKLVGETSEQFSEKYTGLHSDIKNLLLELQEIKRARIDLQTKLESLR